MFTVRKKKQNTVTLPVYTSDIFIVVEGGIYRHHCAVKINLLVKGVKSM